MSRPGDSSRYHKVFHILTPDAPLHLVLSDVGSTNLRLMASKPSPTTSPHAITIDNPLLARKLFETADSITAVASQAASGVVHAVASLRGKNAYPFNAPLTTLPPAEMEIEVFMKVGQTHLFRNSLERLTVSIAELSGDAMSNLQKQFLLSPVVSTAREYSAYIEDALTKEKFRVHYNLDRLQQGMKTAELLSEGVVTITAQKTSFRCGLLRPSAKFDALPSIELREVVTKRFENRATLIDDLLKAMATWTTIFGDETRQPEIPFAFTVEAPGVTPQFTVTMLRSVTTKSFKLADGVCLSFETVRETGRSRDQVIPFQRRQMGGVRISPMDLSGKVLIDTVRSLREDRAETSTAPLLQNLSVELHEYLRTSMVELGRIDPNDVDQAVQPVALPRSSTAFRRLTDLDASLLPLPVSLSYDSTVKTLYRSRELLLPCRSKLLWCRWTEQRRQTSPPLPLLRRTPVKS